MTSSKEKNIGGRPKMGIANKRTYKITFKLNTLEYYHLKGLAIKSNINLSECIRELVANGYVKERISKEHLSVIRQLIGMSTNLNQLAKTANIYGHTAVEMQNAELSESIVSIIRTIGDDR